MKRTVMTFNIRYGSANDGVDSWNNRKGIVVDIINKYNPSLLGLQEVEKEQLDFLVNNLAQYKWLGVGRDDGENMGEFNPIFYRSDCYDLLESNTFSLSETPDIFGNKGWDGICNRIVTWAKLKTKNTEKVLYIYNTHFDVNGEEARIKSAQLLLSKICENYKSNRNPIIVTGDFNCNESSLPYQIITAKKENYAPVTFDLDDAMSISHNEHSGPVKTFHSFTGIEEEKIDYIFVKNLIVKNHVIINENINGRYPSDHFPVLVEFNI